jgi:RNA polymerase sigma factor (sigma-70 family)
VKYSREEFAREIAVWRGLTPLAVLSRPEGGDEICRRLGPLVRSFVDRELARSGLLSFYAEDLTQSVLLRVWCTFGRVPSLDENRLWAWLRLLTHRLVVNALKHERRFRRAAPRSRRPLHPLRPAASTDEDLDDRVLVDEDDPAWLVVARERGDIVDATIAQLTPRQRIAITRSVVLGETVTEIATYLCVSRWVVAREIASAMTVLRQRLADVVEIRAPRSTGDTRRKRIG